MCNVCIVIFYYIFFFLILLHLFCLSSCHVLEKRVACGMCHVLYTVLFDTTSYECCELQSRARDREIKRAREREGKIERKREKEK